MITRIIFSVLLLLNTVWVIANTASFTNSNVCEGSQTFFSSTSVATSGTIVEYNWDMDEDGSFDDASGATTAYQFLSSGPRDVSLQIVTSLGDTAEVTQQVVVNPVANVAFTATEVCEGNPTNLSDASVIHGGAIANWSWDFDSDNLFDDGSGDAIANVFGSAGTIDVGLKVITDSGCVSSIYQSVTIHPNPSLSFSFENVCVGDLTQFHGEADVQTGFISDYDWELNGNNFYDDASGQDISTQFVGTGNYQIGLRVTTDKGCQSDTTILVTIAPLPIINFSFSGECEGNPVDFTNLSSNQVGSIDYDWSFGDTQNSSDVSPSHTYIGDGVFSVTLIGTSSLGCIDSLTQTVSIFPGPKADFTFTDVCFGEETDFTNNSDAQSSTIESYLWDFDDGNVSVATSPSHSYENSGAYDVNLVVYSTDGCRDTIIRTINVWELPDASITAFGEIAFCQGESVEIGVSPDNSENVLWSTSSVSETITITNDGEYNVLVYDLLNGCEDRDTIDITVWELPELNISNDTTVSLGYDVPLWVSGAEQYTWSPSTYLDNPLHDMPLSQSPLETISYSVNGIDENGCVNTMDVTITVSADYTLETVNLFTPNGDGANDFFTIKNVDLYSDCELSVFNRWGNEVFNVKGYQNDWDGTYEGETLPEGSYYFMVKCEGTEQVYDGSVSILRRGQ